MSKSKQPVITPSFDLFMPSATIIRNNILVYFILYVLPALLLTLAFARQPDEFNRAFWNMLGIGGLVNLLLYPPLLYTYLQTAKGKTVELVEAFREGYKRFWPILGTLILSGLIIIGGFLLFIVPGIFMLRRYLLAPYYVMDRGLSPMDALKASSHDSILYSGPVFGVIGVNFLFGAIGAIPVIGTIIGTILQILYSVAPGLRYLEIKKAVKA